jgi:hypothetical protein
LETLRDHSLLLVDSTSSGTRYRLLETLREWGVSALDAPTEADLRRRHAEFYLSLVEGALDTVILAARSEELRLRNAQFSRRLKMGVGQRRGEPVGAAGGRAVRVLGDARPFFRGLRLGRGAPGKRLKTAMWKGIGWRGWRVARARCFGIKAT